MPSNENRIELMKYEKENTTSYITETASSENQPFHTGVLIYE